MKKYTVTLNISTHTVGDIHAECTVELVPYNTDGTPYKTPSVVKVIARDEAYVLPMNSRTPSMGDARKRWTIFGADLTTGVDFITVIQRMIDDLSSALKTIAVETKMDAWKRSAKLHVASDVGIHELWKAITERVMAHWMSATSFVS